LLLGGLFVCLLGMIFGLVQYVQIRSLPVHKAMREISELIWETCKTYLFTQGKFLAILWAFIAIIIVVYFGVLLHFTVGRVAVDRPLQHHRHPGQLLGRLVRHPHQHLRQLAHLLRGTRGKPFPTMAIPLRPA